MDRSHCHRSKLPPNAPDIIFQNTVDVSDPAQVLLWYRDERRRQFNILVRRYKSQLLHGCQDPNCQTPTCASYQKRVSEGPYRRYTELSARTLACYLASLDNAETGLCRNPPRVHSELSSQDSTRRSKRRTPTHSAQSPARPESIASVEKSRRTRPSISSTDNTANVNSTIQPLEDGLVRSASPLRGSRKHMVGVQGPSNPPTERLKDPKSFTQNLFDTLSLRMIEWLPLRRSPGSFDLDQARSHYRETPRSPNSDTCQAHLDSDKDQPYSKERPYQTNAGSNPHTPSSRSTGSQTTAVELKLPNQQFKRLSLTETELRRSNSKSSLDEKPLADLKPARKLSVSAHANANADEFVNIPSPPALRHRPQKHRGRAADANNTRAYEKAKKERRVSWDGTKFLNDVQSQHQPDSTPGPKNEHPPKTQPPKDHQRRHHDGPQLALDISTIQSLSHLNDEIIDGLKQTLIISEEEAEKWREELAFMEISGSFEDSEWRVATSRQRAVFTFITQSVFYALGSSRQLLRSFRKDTARLHDSNEDSKLNLQQLQPSLRKLFSICPKDIVFHSLWNALEALFVPPKELSASARNSRRSSCNSSTTTPVSAPIIIRRSSETASHQYITDANAADVATVVLFALASALPEIDNSTWSCMALMRSTGCVAMGAAMEEFRLDEARVVVEATDVLEHELALRLVDRLVRGLTARLAFHEISKTRPAYSQQSSKRKSNVLDTFVEILGQHTDLVARSTSDRDSNSQPSAPAIINEWLRTLFMRSWDGNPEISRSSSEGGVVQILSVLYRERNRLGLTSEDFHTHFLAERLDPLEMPVEWIARVSSNKTLHLLSYPFLFPPSSLVTYFRALNYSAMSKYYEAAMTTTRHVSQTALGAIEIQDDIGLLARMRTSMTTYLVLVIRRDNILTDALNQLWRRERRELMRPLKVQMGMDEGEEGLDHGGVQQEFFRLLMAEALDPSYGMFTTDARTRLSWFQPCSLEPLYKFELLGLLMSLAIYNGLTLPVNFPTAFYRKLLGLKVKLLDHIRDGWPELTRGLEELLRWNEGDVGDIFMRTYEFSFEAFGRVETVDMEKVRRDAPWHLSGAAPPSGRSVRYSPSWSDVRRYTDQASLSPPSSMAAETADSHDDAAKFAASLPPLPSPTPPADEAALVTNDNRDQFVKDYIFWLTDKSIRPQFDAFAKGFYTCLDRQSLSIFTPEALKTVVEGIQEIDMGELKRHARYEGGFSGSHRVIQDFWDIVGEFSAEKKAQLLEFVTASDRVPVNGISSIMFVIQKNGVGDARLPTSLTCFGRLLLPEYSSKSMLEEKLNKALENAQGFGVA